ncbi:MAG: IS30 family transposase, partial [Sodaliphilus pleomorphus]
MPSLLWLRGRAALFSWRNSIRESRPFHRANAVVRLIRESGLPVRSITTDNGPEFAAHEIIARELNTKVYFAHPYCSWEKGAIENMNGLIRQYIPKKTDFRGISRLYVK